MHGVNQLAASRPASCWSTGEGFCYSRHSLVLSRTNVGTSKPIPIDLDVVFPLFWKVVLLVDGAHRTDRNTRATADTLVCLNVELRVLLRRFFRFRVDGIHWTRVDTRGVSYADARFSKSRKAMNFPFNQRVFFTALSIGSLNDLQR